MLITPHPARRLQQRLPRETFTRRLSRICEALDRCSRMMIRSKLSRLSPEYVETEVEIDQLWAAGSYGRGASHCADLDLVARRRLLHMLPQARRQVPRRGHTRQAIQVIGHLEQQVEGGFVLLVCRQLHARDSLLRGARAADSRSPLGLGFSVLRPSPRSTASDSRRAPAALPCRPEGRCPPCA